MRHHNDEVNAVGDAEARTIVVALGGNALAPPGRGVTIHDQFRHTRESLHVVVELVRMGWSVVIVHGNGPQVGDALMRNELAAGVVEPLPLGVLVAGTAGWIGYMIQQSLSNELRSAGIPRQVVTMITQTDVLAAPAELEPVKPIGGALTRAVAAQLRSRGVPLAKDKQGRMRRLAPSPVPVEVVEWPALVALLDHGCVVVAGGGGGIPVYRGSDGAWQGVEAVVDKDRTAAILAQRVGADTLLILTSVPAIYRGWGTDDAHPIDRMTVAEATQLLGSEDLGAGSMAPKLEAAITFLREGGKRAIIADLGDGIPALRGETGTTIIGDST